MVPSEEQVDLVNFIAMCSNCTEKYVLVNAKTMCIYVCANLLSDWMKNRVNQWK